MAAEPTRPPGIEAALAARLGPAEAVLGHIGPRDDLIVGLGNAEPATVIDAIEAGADGLDELRLHQMLPLRPRRYFNGEVPGLRHVSWFLSPVLREPYAAGKCDLVPNNFSDVPSLMRRATKCSLVLASAAPPDRHGYFSLGLHAEYVAALIGEAPFFIESNARMPRTHGENQVHVSQVAGWCEADYELGTLPTRPPNDADRTIAGLVVERVPDGATIQAGVGSVPDAVLAGLTERSDLGVHTELMSDGFVGLIEAGAVTGTRKALNKNRAVTTTVLGTERVHEFARENAGIELWPVDYTNDPRMIAREPRMTAINATLEVDFLGQCASESIGTDYWSSSGGQGDYARGAVHSAEGQSFTVLHSAPHDASVSRIVPMLHPGAAITTHKNVVDNVVTEHGVAELRGRPVRERAERLIAIAHPKFRDELREEAVKLGYI